MHHYNGDNSHGINNFDSAIADYGSVNYDDTLETDNTDASNRNKNFWRIEYNFTSLYRLPGISVETLDSLSHRLKTNRSWFDMYFRTNNVNLKLDPEKRCPDEYCRRVQNCAISHVDYAEYQYCVERGDGFVGDDIIGLAYDVTSDANTNVLFLLFRTSNINVLSILFFVFCVFSVVIY